MYRNQNISARTKSRSQKENCFNRNIPVLNIIFYIGNGFMLRKQIIILVRFFYQINEHKANEMITDLLSYGLLVKKQATDTRTCIYIMTKFPLSVYHECSTRDSCSIKLNNRKIWNNIYRTEFIIRQVISFMEQLNVEVTLENLFNFLTDYGVSIFTTENQMSIDDYSDYLDVKNMLEKEKDLISSPKEYRRSYYSLFNMVAAGFFFIGKPIEGNIIIGTFDKCNNMYLKKIYENIICIYLMLERYLGFYPRITLQVYMSDLDRIIALRNKENEQSYDYTKQEKSGLTKRDNFFHNMRIPRQNWDDIQVDYIYYPLREKYNL